MESVRVADVVNVVRTLCCQAMPFFLPHLFDPRLKEQKRADCNMRSTLLGSRAVFFSSCDDALRACRDGCKLHSVVLV